MIAAIFSETLRILSESAIYLLLGFALAGLLHVLLLRRERLVAPLSGRGLRPVVLAALIGAPIPLCSCGVLPAGLALQRRGASKGAAASFLITTPETDVVSILLTYNLIGPVMAVARPIIALFTGVTAGVAINAVDARHRPAPGTRLKTRGAGRENPASLPDPAGGAVAVTGGGGATAAGEVDAGCNACDPAETHARSRGGWLGEAVRFGFVEFFDDLILRLCLGLLLGAIIGVVFGRLDLAPVAGHAFWSYLVMATIGIPLYVCAAASTPVAAGLIAAGISPGAALVFLLCGPATSIVALTVLSRQFGRLLTAVYVASVAVLSVLAGLGLDRLLRAGWLPAPDPRRMFAADGGSALGWIGTVIFLGLVAWSAHRRNAASKVAGWIERVIGRPVTRRAVLTGAAAVVVAAWILGGLFTVLPGERAVVTRFGAITAPYLGPGLHYHWPWPFGAKHVIAAGRIERVEIGFRSASASAADEGLPPAPQDEGAALSGVPANHGSPTESWMLTGDENILDLQCVVHWQVPDTPEAVRRALFEVRDPEELVRGAARWALQEALGARPIEALLTVARAEVERTVVEDLLQPALDACGSGLRVVGVELVSVHAPTPVHWAFRDVAGAAEDAAQYVNAARAYTESTVREALGDSARGVALALGEATERVERARGETVAFDRLNQEQRRSPALTRSRLRLEKLESVLPHLRVYVDLTGGAGAGPDLWLRRGEGWEALPFGGLAAGGSTGAPGSGGKTSGGAEGGAGGQDGVRSER